MIFLKYHPSQKSIKRPDSTFIFRPVPYVVNCVCSYTALTQKNLLFTRSILHSNHNAQPCSCGHFHWIMLYFFWLIISFYYDYDHFDLSLFISIWLIAVIFYLTTESLNTKSFTEKTSFSLRIKENSCVRLQRREMLGWKKNYTEKKTIPRN